LARQLLSNHQLEFVTGGWVQPDEANSELYAMELQLQEGHDWIRSNLGEEYIPHYGWAIDPFGYSPTMAWLLHKYGFRAMLIQRVHYAVKKELAQKKHLEFYWRQTWDWHGDHDIFTHIMPFFSYDVPHT
jgi:alpha-mannosidase II